MTTKTWDGTTNDWYNNNGTDWSPTGDPAASDDVIINSGEAYLNPGDAGFTVASITLSGVLAIADPGVTQSVTGNLTNNGIIYVDQSGAGGSALTIGGDLTNTAPAGVGGLQIGNGGMTAASTVTVDGAVNNSGGLGVDGGSAAGAQAQLVVSGAFNGTGNGLYLYGGSATGTQALVEATGSAAPSTLTGTFVLQGDTGGAAVEYGSGGITAIGNATTAGNLELNGANAFIEVGATNSNNTLTDLASIAAGSYLQLYNGATVSTTTALTNNGIIYVDSSGAGGSALTIGGDLTNSGAIQIGVNAPSSLSAPTTVTATDLVNTTTGSILLVGYAAAGTTSQATLDITSGSAPATWTGTANLGGDALLEFASGQITSIAAGATLTLNNIYGAPSRVADASDTTSNSALTQLASNAGTFELLNGNGLADQATGAFSNSGTFALQENATFSTPAGFTNSGGLYVDNGSGQGGSTVTIGGTLTNSNLVQIGPGDGSLSAPTMVTAADLNNTGTITLYGSGTNNASLKVNTFDQTAGAARSPRRRST